MKPVARPTNAIYLHSFAISAISHNQMTSPIRRTGFWTPDNWSKQMETRGRTPQVGMR